MIDYTARMKCYEVEELFEYRKWAGEIPFLKFKENWIVKVIPPFCGAVVRFLVADKSEPTLTVSCYLDCYENLGCCGEPYWEIYPHDDDVFRCGMDEAEELIEAIEYALIQRVGREANEKL
jgi:hypothetical protein